MPILDIQRRWRELGRIRMGRKTEKGMPTSTTTFRLTSSSEELLHSAAELWGGTVGKWADAPGVGEQWQLQLDSEALPIAIPPGNALSQWYEMWSGGGCQRRCDGEREHLTDTDCLCPVDPEERRDLAKKGKACQPTTRLNVMIPDLWDLGVWRLETHGFHAAAELAGVAIMLQEATRLNQVIPARLRIEQRTAKRGGKTQHYVVPVLEVGERIGSLLSSLGMLDRSPPSGPVAQQAVGGGGIPRREALPGASVATPPPPPLPGEDEPPKPAESKKLSPAQKLAITTRQLGLSDDDRHSLIGWFTDGKTESSKDLTSSELADLHKWLDQVLSGKMQIMRGEDDGQVYIASADQVESNETAQSDGSGGWTSSEWKAALGDVAGVGQATLLKHARGLAQEWDMSIPASIAALAEAPESLQTEVMSWLKAQ